MAKYYIIAGEASGDLHGGNLIRAIRNNDPSAEVRCWGGHNMEAAGATVVKHIRELAFMGFWEVLKNLRTILSNISLCKNDINSFQPDVVVLIDYPGFNFRLLKFLHQHEYKIVWYISPQVWAWKESRVKLIKKYVHRLLVIFPFEVDFYKKWNVDAKFVGHPLLDIIGTQSTTVQTNVVALLPGSRKQEIEKMLPLYAAVAKHFPDKKFLVAGMNIHGANYYQKFVLPPNCSLKLDSTYEILQTAAAAIVTSGTATMETALHQVPQVVCYKGSPLSFFIGRLVVKVPFIAMVNLVCGRKIVEELIQHQATEKNISVELNKLFEPSIRNKMLNDYKDMMQKLGSEGASKNAAKEIHELVNKTF